MRYCKTLTFALLLLPSLCLAQVTEYVCITPGGGSSAAILAQYSRVYSTMATWEAQNMNLTTTNSAGSGGTKHICHIIGDWTNIGAENAQVAINGWTTTGVTNDIILTAPQTPLAGCTDSTRHSGIWSTSKHRLQPSGAAVAGSVVAITISDNWTTIDGIQIRNSLPGKVGTYGIFISTVDASTFYINNNLLSMNMSAIDSQAGALRGVYINDADATVYFMNNVVTDAISGTTLAYGIQVNNAATAFVYNNTVYRSYTAGIRQVTGVVIAKNNIVFGTSTAGADLSGTITSDHNATEDAETGSIIPDFNQVFVDGSGYAGTSNFHLSSGCTLLATDLYGSGLGPDLPGGDANVPTTDFEFDPRSGVSACVGADEYIATAATTPPRRKATATLMTWWESLKDWISPKVWALRKE